MRSARPYLGLGGGGDGVLATAARRAASALPVVLVAVAATFLLLRLVPGDPAELMAGPQADRAAVAAIRASLHLDRPMIEQFGLYLGRVVRGDFGISTMTGRPVSEEIAQRLPVTCLLTVGATLFALLLGPALGALAAFRRDGVVDLLLSLGAVAGICVPSFWLGMMLIFVFAGQLRWLPSMGIGGPASWILPSITLGLAPLGLMARMTRASMLEVMGESYVWAARARGVPERLVMMRHALRNACLPVLAVAGTQIGYMIGGAMVTEATFSIPGFGRLIVDAVLSKDYAVVQAGVLVTAILVVLINLVVDLLSTALDPRIRGRGAAR